MAAANGRTDAPLDQLLFESPYRFEFFQAVRLLERLMPARRAVGRAGSPAREVARFRAHASLAFPASQVHDLRRNGDDTPPEMTVAFMGLTGPLGALPTPYTELLIERARSFRRRRKRAANEDNSGAATTTQPQAHEHPLVDFLDLFNHRLISLFYRAWEKYRFPIAYERQLNAPDEPGARALDPFTEAVFALIGMGTPGLRGRVSFKDESLLAYSGLIAQRPHSASTLAAVLQDYFAVPVRIEQFVDQRVRLEEGSLTRLGTANNQLGVNAVAGAEVSLHQAKFRVVLGPLSFDRFIDFLPQGGAAYQPACELTRLLAGPEFDFELQPVLQAAAVPDTVPTTEGERRPRLGWTSWLKTRPLTADADQVILATRN